jgi:signal transduction histidine kinase
MVRRFGLRVRMAASYVLVTTAAVLAVEAVLIGLLVPRLLTKSDSVQHAQFQASIDAKTLSLIATKIASAPTKADDGQMLTEAAYAGKDQTPLGGRFVADPRGVKIAYDPSPTSVTAEVLVDLDGRVVASSAPRRYPPGSRLPVHWDRLTGGSGVAKTKSGPVTWAASPVATALFPDVFPAGKSAKKPSPKDKAEQKLKDDAKLHPIGMLYVQAPAGQGPAFGAIEPMVTTGIAVLGLAVPVGVLFGLLSTRRLIRRLRRLADATGAVAQGDFRPRVPVEGADEIGRLEDSLNRMAERLDAALDTERRLAGTEARRAERARIARELHDSISQDLFSMSLLAGGLRRALPTGSALRPEAETMERAASRMMREMQALLLELRPVALEDTGLRPALAGLCRAYETRLGIPVHADLEEVTLEPPAEHAVLRVIQEALGNAVRHAAPDAIHVRVAAEEDTIGIEVRDDGCGFDPGEVADRHGMGLTLMRERIEELGGRFTLTTRPGSGTAVHARLPREAVAVTGEPS